ncbi:MAG: class I SAM-dependent methyltransferase [Lysobacterales bacterium]
MDNNEISVSTFNKLAEEYQQKYMDFDFYFDTYDRFCELVKNDNATIFEIACGPGNITKYLLNKRPGFKIEGIDLAPSMVELARANNPTATFRVMDSRAIATIDKTFDAVVCGFCTPYLCRDDVARLIGDVRGLLKKDGIFYLSTMEDEYEKSGLQTSDSGDRVFIYYHAMAYLEQQLANSGFRIVDFRRKAFPAGKGQPATDLFLIARAI